jgi:ElaB/YqjD/DUF883 family membrane-anchored ribosome-binding protein
MTIRKPQSLPQNNNVFGNATAELRKDIDALKQDLSSLSQHAVEAGAEGAAHLRQHASESYDQLRASSRQNMARLESRIRQKPAQSMAIAFAVGALVSMLFGGRSSSNRY